LVGLLEPLFRVWGFTEMRRDGTRRDATCKRAAHIIRALNIFQWHIKYLYYLRAWIVSKTSASRRPQDVYEGEPCMRVGVLSFVPELGTS
jgi:hypothetical protein